jgi:hypothetical protein
MSGHGCGLRVPTRESNPNRPITSSSAADGQRLHVNVSMSHGCDAVEVRQLLYPLLYRARLQGTGVDRSAP